jgi:hypothetical protein
MVRTTDRKKIAEDTDLSRALAKKRRIVLVAESPSCVPERFRTAADAILQIGPRYYPRISLPPRKFAWIWWYRKNRRNSSPRCR